MHTPGPWSVGYDGASLPIIVTSSAGRFEIIGHAAALDRNNGEGNARLMAAAPDLLEALKDALAHLEYCNYGDNWEREGARAQKLPQKIEAAIAKVEGQ